MSRRAVDTRQPEAPQRSPAGRGAVQTLRVDDFPSPGLARALSPNGRVHWARRAEAKRAVARHIAAAAVLQGIGAVDGPVRVSFRWVFPTNGRHDIDNLIATSKPIIDALVTAGILEDDDSRHVVAVSADVAVEKGRRALEITLARAGEEAE